MYVAHRYLYRITSTYVKIKSNRVSICSSTLWLELGLKLVIKRSLEVGKTFFRAWHS